MMKEVDARDAHAHDDEDGYDDDDDDDDGYGDDDDADEIEADEGKSSVRRFVSWVFGINN